MITIEDDSMSIINKNFSGQTVPKLIALKYVSCNFTQPVPAERDGKRVGVRLFPGDDTPRTFDGCRLTNCELPPGSTIVGNQKIIIKEFEILSGYDEIEIDDEVLKIPLYMDVVYGWCQDGQYTYEETE